MSYKCLKLKLRVFLAGHTCSPVIGQFIDTMIVALTDNEWL